MPFKGAKARERINHLTYKYDGQSLKVKYNAGQKYAELEEELHSEEIPEGESLREAKLRVASQLCRIIEDWDFELEDGSKLPIEPEALVNEGLRLDFYTGLTRAIAEDAASGGQAGKGR